MNANLTTHTNAEERSSRIFLSGSSQEARMNESDSESYDLHERGRTIFRVSSQEARMNECGSYDPYGRVRTISPYLLERIQPRAKNE
jgi:hypothetical protein